MLWITGSKGLLGSALLKVGRCKAALHLKPEDKDLLLGTGKEVDITDLKAVRSFVKKQPKITHIINCAAFSQVDAAEKLQEEAFRANAIGPENLAIVASDINAQLIHISTDYVFPGDGTRPLREEDPTGPCSTYGMSKLEGEKRVLKYPCCVIRTSWIFGEGGKNFVSKLLQMLQTEKEIRLTSDQWGRFTYAPDLAAAILDMLDQKGLFHFANQGITTKYEFGLAMCEEALAMGYPIRTEKILPVPGSSFPAPCKRPTFSAFDTSKIEKIIQLRPWRESLKEFLCEKRLPAYL